MKFKDFINELNEAQTLDGQDKEIILNLFDAFETKYFKISKVKVAKNVTFQIDFKMKENDTWMKRDYKKADVLKSLAATELERIGLIVSRDNAKYKDAGTNITSASFYSHSAGGKASFHRIEKDENISIIISTPKQNILSPEVVKKIERIIEKKISSLKNKKTDPKTLSYILKKLFPGNYRDSLEIEKAEFIDLEASNGKTYSGKGFRLDPKNKFGSHNSNPILDIESGFGILSDSDVDDLITRTFIKSLRDFYEKTYELFDAQFYPSIANNFSANLHPVIYAIIK